MNQVYLNSLTLLGVQQALNALVKQFGYQTINGGVGSCLVFQPGGISGGNIYNDWESLVSVAESIAGIKVVYFDDSIEECHIPEGDWDLGGYTVFYGKSTLSASTYPSGLFTIK